MNRFAAITAAIVLSGAASIATSARADSYTACQMAGSVAGLAMTQRAHGASQYEAAATSGAIISEIVNASDADYATRSVVADRLAGVSTFVIWLVYSVPLDRSVPTWMHAQAAEQVVFEMCLEGDL